MNDIQKDNFKKYSPVKGGFKYFKLGQTIPVYFETIWQSETPISYEFRPRSKSDWNSAHLALQDMAQRQGANALQVIEDGPVADGTHQLRALPLFLAYPCAEGRYSFRGLQTCRRLNAERYAAEHKTTKRWLKSRGLTTALEILGPVATIMKAITNFQ